MPEAEQTLTATERPERQRPDYFGCVLGILVFLGGMALLLLTFKFAYDMFTVAPEDALNMRRGETMDLNVAGTSFGWVFVRILLLLLMAFIGSMVATRGINLYLAGRKELIVRADK